MCGVYTVLLILSFLLQPNCSKKTVLYVHTQKMQHVYLCYILVITMPSGVAMCFNTGVRNTGGMGGGAVTHGYGRATPPSYCTSNTYCDAILISYILMTYANLKLLLQTPDITTILEL